MSIPVFLLGEIQCLANLFLFFYFVLFLAGAKLLQFHSFPFWFFAVRDFRMGRGMDGVLGGVKSHRKRDKVIEKGWKDEGQHKEKTGSTVGQEKQNSIFSRGWGGKSHKTEPQKREQKLDFFLVSLPFFIHTVLLWGNMGEQEHGGGSKERLRKRYLSCEQMEKKRDVGNKRWKLTNKQ